MAQILPDVDQILAELIQAVTYYILRSTKLKKKLKKKTKLRSRSPQENYTERATTACRRSRQPLQVESVA
jgi:hypothetical protein